MTMNCSNMGQYLYCYFHWLGKKTSCSIWRCLCKKPQNIVGSHKNNNLVESPTSKKNEKVMKKKKKVYKIIFTAFTSCIIIILLINFYLIGSINYITFERISRINRFTLENRIIHSKMMRYRSSDLEIFNFHFRIAIKQIYTIEKIQIKASHKFIERCIQKWQFWVVRDLIKLWWIQQIIVSNRNIWYYEKLSWNFKLKYFFYLNLEISICFLFCYL